MIGLDSSRYVLHDSFHLDNYEGSLFSAMDGKRKSIHAHIVIFFCRKV